MQVTILVNILAGEIKNMQALNKFGDFLKILILRLNQLAAGNNKSNAD